MMNHPRKIALQRIQKELHDLENNPVRGISIVSDSDRDSFKFSATITGPPDTPYEAGLFKLNISVDTNYPFKPPKVTFLTKIYHCNIGESGNICLDILQDNWRTTLTLAEVLLCIVNLLCEPNCLVCLCFVLLLLLLFLNIIL
eukprot:TRINITY_DN3748_c0_g1_i1.p1 TRINITY_DN3748_c0_g1~~TRINITY_DN3748_c0_g1_i1.p1  ORF type:complete len:143 (-),score=12.92 TRINITY_DN3748_c0_g1_i1:192-620(-)